jgi:hypothetical protein
LTPEGIKEKTQKTIDYIKRSYQAIQQLQNRVSKLALKHNAEGKKIFIYKKDEDEIYNLVTKTLNSLDVNYEVISKKSKLKEINNDNDVIYYWNSGLDMNNIDVYNILK